MEDGLHIVCVWVNDVGGVVAGVVVRALTGNPVVGASGRERRLVETIDRFTVGGRERNVNRRRRLTGHDHEVFAPLRPEGDLPVRELDLTAPPRVQRRSVEAPALLEVAHAKGQMVEERRSHGLGCFIGPAPRVHARARSRDGASMVAAAK